MITLVVKELKLTILLISFCFYTTIISYSNMMNRDLSCDCLIPVEVPMSCNICDNMLTETDCSIWPTMWKEEVMVSEVEAEIEAHQSSGIVISILLKPCGFLNYFF